ncbi:UDP-N-acetylmuramoyl-L-alanine--D-glutamate ligase [Sphingomonas oryzagri]|uniref:UDP-N-acetylmuramoylalanine--D-glutamate ligase n=1 Tax=Sphingomonas oryzagri TaxID=3042314 RepID=A0ABT6N2H1_9SPHN|nr:UDP-N-acetylmuramoyl-L-alanine--D-glutamate ligase [Sphingomonas oryzagri]MDH7639455.1 UDP-N-acetylmuramoyl-L-alanine--D-glutamate ligase [Sphingomonas oryzagri]
MIVSPVFAGKRYAVLGLARSGLATARALIASGASVTAWDLDEAKREALVDEVQALSRSLDSVTLGLADPLVIDLAGYDGIVVSPGVPLNTHPIAARAKAAGVPVIGDIELFAQARASLPEHKVVAITGTNGKSTTTALIHHILQTAGVPTTLGGNIGLPILGQEPLPAGGVYVLELSSFQIDLTFTLDADVAVLTNITPDHLDRYDGFEAYAASKERLFAMQHSGAAVIAIDDDPSLKIAARLSADREPKRKFDPTYEGGEVLAVSQAIGAPKVGPSLAGPHNAQNAVVALAATELLGISRDKIDEALLTYPGLPHRMQRVAEIDGVLYVNDSKATNATSTAPALGAYPRIHWILGGKRKTDDLDACKPFYGHVVSAWTIGEAAELFERILLESGIHARNVGTLNAAVKQAAQIARPGEVVLLSPACASYDQFRDYEARGDAFRAAVSMLGSEA